MRHIVMLFLCVIMVCSGLRMPLKRVFPRFQTSLHVDDAKTDPTPTETTPPAKTKSPFLDLFAAGERKPVIAPSTPPTPATTPAPSTPVAVDTKSVVSTPSIAPVPVPGSMSSRNTFMEMQAELLRLEAEKEQLEIDQERLVVEKKRLEDIDELLLKLLDGSVTMEKAITSQKSLIRKELFFRLAELANAALVSDERNKYATLCDDLMETVQKTDNLLHAELTAEIQKELNLELNRLKSGQKSKDSENAKVYEQVLQQWVQNTINGSTTVSTTPGNEADKSLPSFEIGGRTIVPMSGPSNTSSFPADMLATNIVRFPAAVPINLLPFLLRASRDGELSKEDVTILTQAVFTDDILENPVADFSALLGEQIVTFRGSPRVSPAETLAMAQKRISLVPGMSDRVRVFALPEYQLINGPPTTPGGTTTNTSLVTSYEEKYGGTKYEPVFLVIPAQAQPKPQGTTELAFGFVSLLATLVTCFLYSTDTFSLNQAFIQRAMETLPLAPDGTLDTSSSVVISQEAADAARDVVGRVLQILFGVLGVQFSHDLGHIIAAKFHNVKISTPYFLPSLQIGLFGTITNFLSYPKTRNALFDVAIAGPTLGFLTALGVTCYGLALTASAGPDTVPSFPALPYGFFSSSLLLDQLADQFLHIHTVAADALGQGLGMAQGQGLAPADTQGLVGAMSIVPSPVSLVALHPLVIVGLTGILTNAFNFLPIGRLDGGRVTMAVGGRQAANTISSLALLAQAVSFFSNNSPIIFFWMLAVVFLQRGADIPPEDDITPIATEQDDKNIGPLYVMRALALGLCITLTAATITPVPTTYDTNPTTTTTTISDSIQQGDGFNNLFAPPKNNNNIDI